MTSFTLSPLLLLVAATTLSSTWASEQAYQRATQEAGINQVKEYFDSQGFVLLKNFYKDENKQLLKQVKKAGQSMFDNLFKEMYDNGHSKFPEHSRVIFDADADGTNEKKREYAMWEGKQRGFKEIVMRNPGRYEVSLILNKLDGPDMDPLVQALLGVIPPLFGQDINNITGLNMHMSYIMATAESAEQKWHSDGEHLDLEQHLPVHCLNAFIPLVDVPMERGPTELFPTSHFVTRQPSPMKFDPADLKPPYAPELKLGDILLFDYRILHRGKPNLSKMDRPYLVLTFSEPWFHDSKNWPTRSMKDKVSAPLWGYPSMNVH